MRKRKHRYVKAKALAAQLAEIPKNEAFFGVSFSILFLHEKKEYAPGGRFSLRSGELVLEQPDFAQLNQLLCINPSGVLADTTSLYTREALVLSNSAGAMRDCSLPRSGFQP